MMKVNGVMTVWSIRAGELAGAASNRKGYAQSLSAGANKYMKLGEWEMARDENLQAHQAMDQAQQFAKMADSAYHQAVALNKSQKWYIYAEQAIAANTLAVNTPPDVQPPMFPALPR